jgi:hypothetical protein
MSDRSAALLFREGAHQRLLDDSLLASGRATLTSAFHERDRQLGALAGERNGDGARADDPRNRDPPDERFRLCDGAAARDRVGDVRMEWSCLLVGGDADRRVCW